MCSFNKSAQTLSLKSESDLSRCQIPSASILCDLRRLLSVFPQWLPDFTHSQCWASESCEYYVSVEHITSETRLMMPDRPRPWTLPGRNWPVIGLCAHGCVLENDDRHWERKKKKKTWSGITEKCAVCRTKGESFSGWYFIVRNHYLCYFLSMWFEILKTTWN